MSSRAWRLALTKVVRLSAGLNRSAEAACADLHSDRHAIDDERLLLHVRLERAVGLGSLPLPATGVLVSDPAAEGRTFAADVASCH